MELSSSFVTIYNQAKTTGNSKLTEVYGQGYRKSLEFLIKDYAIKFHPNDIHIIKNINLSQCIEAYIENSRIKSLSKTSAWIGNEETHPISDGIKGSFLAINTFILATMYFIFLYYTNYVF